MYHTAARTVEIEIVPLVDIPAAYIDVADQVLELAAADPAVKRQLVRELVAADVAPCPACRIVGNRSYTSLIEAGQRCSWASCFACSHAEHFAGIGTR